MFLQQISNQFIVCDIRSAPVLFTGVNNSIVRITRSISSVQLSTTPSNGKVKGAATKKKASRKRVESEVEATATKSITSKRSRSLSAKAEAARIARTGKTKEIGFDHQHSCEEQKWI